MRHGLLAAWLAVLVLGFSTAWAQPDDEGEPVVEVATPDTKVGRELAWVLRVINGEPMGDPAARFTPRYIEITPKAEIERVTTLRKESFGGKPVILVRVWENEENPDSLDGVISTLEGRRFLSVFITLDDKSGLIAGLRFNATGFDSEPGDWNSFEGAAGRLGGQVSFGVYELVPADPANPAGELRLHGVYEFNERDSVPIGAASHLWTLGALAERIGAGKCGWFDGVPIREEAKCIPGGELAREAPGTTHTLRDLAERMIAASDTTAAEHLFHAVGRSEVEAYMARVVRDPRPNQPLLSMREFFYLKLTGDVALRERWIAGTKAERSAMLAEGGGLAGEAPDWKRLSSWTSPREVDRVEFFASVEDTCRVVADLRRLEQVKGLEAVGTILRVDGGPLALDPRQWKSVGFKGGGEPGMLSQFWLLERDDGRWYTMGLAWHHRTEQVDEERLAKLARAGIDILLRHARPGTPDGK